MEGFDGISTQASVIQRRTRRCCLGANAASFCAISIGSGAVGKCSQTRHSTADEAGRSVVEHPRSALHGEAPIRSVHCRPQKLSVAASEMPTKMPHFKHLRAPPKDSPQLDRAAVADPLSMSRSANNSATSKSVIRDKHQRTWGWRLTGVGDNSVTSGIVGWCR